MKIASPLLTLAGVSLLAACAPVESTGGPAPLTEKNAKYLEKAMRGRVAGEPVRCVSSFGSPNFNPVSDDLVLIQSGSIVYQNRLENSCRGLGDDNDILVFEKFGSDDHCKGDVFKIVDRYSGGLQGVCRLGEFVPYRKPKG